MFEIIDEYLESGDYFKALKEIENLKKVLIKMMLIA